MGKKNLLKPIVPQISINMVQSWYLDLKGGGGARKETMIRKTEKKEWKQIFLDKEPPNTIIKTK